jgi:poly-gamma-glutamate synthesis protein (capsule biosynthesis protein)
MLVLAGDWAPSNLRVNLEINFDLLLVNLEGPIITHGPKNPTSKAGPSLYSSYFPRNASKMGFALANNHSMDFGANTLKQTLWDLKLKGAIYAGFGDNQKESRQITYFKHDFAKLAWISACEPQFGVSTDRSAGVAAIGTWMIPAIEEASSNADFVIVSIHGGNEDLPWPSPHSVDFYHTLAEAGASIIHGHHPHVPQGFEKYGNTSIFYGLGNFAVNPANWAQTPNGLWSLTVQFDPTSRDLWIPNPVFIDYDKFETPREIKIKYLQNSCSRKANEYFDFVSAPIKDIKLLSGLWQECAFYLFSTYGSRFMEWDQSLGATLKKRLSWLAKDYWIVKKNSELRSFQLTEHQSLLRYHMISCDSHRNVLTTVLGVLGGEIEDLRNSNTNKIFERFRENIYTVR